MSAQVYTLTLPSEAKIFYRSAGPPSAPVLLLLHGFPSSSHQYRHLIPLLATKYRVLAPDLPGFGFTQVPNTYTYTFANLTNTISEFLSALSVTKFSLYVFDYGAPTGYRLALKNPSAITAIITQNGNAYESGLGSFWAQIRELWASNNDPTIRAKLAKNLLSLEATKWQYEEGTKPNKVIAPESYTLDYALLQSPGQDKVQLDLFWDYRNNVAMYPEFQKYFAQSQVPLLAVWGRNDQIFVPAGAEAFKRDLPGAEVRLLDAGHFAVETETEEIGVLVLDFLAKNGI